MAQGEDPDGRHGTLLPSRLHLLLLAVLEFVMGAEAVALCFSQQWMHVFVTILLMAMIAFPALFPARMPIQIPSEIQIFVVLFLFATLFLGEVRDFYHRIWWWDLALHGTSGILLGLLGFLVVYVLNENELVDMRMPPSFVALFAFHFAVSLGAVWEIFEFTMDQLAGTDMQKAMWGDPSGLTDTMWDLIVDTLGALVMALAGWRYMRRARHERTDHWLRRFVDRHPNLFARF
ncbi:hypothetical protein B2G71_18145 [Novosphingobium sp. PC22D]|uniref:hypothetical protein n=1 Tax=Novosphingobium sp. PC22D TaxID=1962403 RepID=UPI000BFAEA63|nr:hypothetical protein [Novosphingobium sp. PC22D]PEQ11210.1 hypothetical protein B2G71_18145 [Novosphingobium sp. PC22D]